MLAALEELLEVAPIGMDDDLFELGGSSLLVPTLTSRLNARYGVDLPLSGLFAEPTARSIARLLYTASEEAQLDSLLRDVLEGGS